MLLVLRIRFKTNKIFMLILVKIKRIERRKEGGIRKDKGELRVTGIKI